MLDPSKAMDCSTNRRVLRAMRIGRLVATLRSIVVDLHMCSPTPSHLPRGARPARAAWIAVLATLVLVAPGGAAEAFSRVIAFGDSYSDSGNWIRLTNGPVWVEHLGDYLGIPDAGLASAAGGDNYAVSGARAVGDHPIFLDAQLARYFDAEPVGDPDALYLIFIGWNDLEPGTNAAAVTAEAIELAVERLVAHGAMTVAVLEISNKATTPRYLDSGLLTLVDLTTDVISANAMIRSAQSVAATRVEVVDIYALTTEVYLTPGEYGFANATNHCSYDPVCEGLAWWDPVHPTTAFHRLIARRVVGVLADLSDAEVDAMTPAEIEARLGEEQDVPVARDLGSYPDDEDPESNPTPLGDWLRGIGNGRGGETGEGGIVDSSLFR